ncbi:hypothetical protein PsorP6_007397 [Peronosclerospora sorghi]|uniref:Uncharacterized protein n=1 Tax=Peronosclerospora sorghi TaxID=230839 RepID=A0ACC0W818_9STRA|nr:hypothetical protein PsorP6_007397 [Peronosclerospora sorghi]
MMAAATATLLDKLVAPKDRNPIGMLTNLVFGYLSELCHLPFTISMELVSMRMQTDSGFDYTLQIMRNSVHALLIGVRNV